MKLLDYLKYENYGKTFDLKDYKYPSHDVTVHLEKDYMDIDNVNPLTQFGIRLYNKVEINERDLTTYWSDFIEHNIELFRDFARDNWINFGMTTEETTEEEEKEFIEELLHMNHWIVPQWIDELHLLLSGYGDDDLYRDLNDMLDKCERIHHFDKEKGDEKK